MTHAIYITIISVLLLWYYWCYTQIIDPTKMQSWADFSKKRKEYMDAKAKALEEVDKEFGRVNRV